MMRAFGLYEINCQLIAVRHGYFHVAAGGGCRKTKDVIREMIGLIELDPFVKLGFHHDDQVVEVESGDSDSENGVEYVDAETSFTPTGVQNRLTVENLDVFKANNSVVRPVDVEAVVFKPVGSSGKVSCSRCGKVVNPVGHVHCSVRKKEYCTRCGFDVLPDGHELRCKPFVPKDIKARLELVGDAMHALDVKVAIALSSCPHDQMTVVAAKYMSAVGQRRYLVHVGIEVAIELNVHSAGSEFERRYFGDFRSGYLRWLSARLECYRRVDGEQVVDMVRSYDLNLV